MGVLADRVAIVTGASGDIGGATARRFTAEGAAVVRTDIRAEAKRALADEPVPAGGRVISITCDVAEESDIDAVVMSAADT